MAEETMEKQREDERWMARALELAKKGLGHVSPNPMVGSVIVRDGKVLGEGFHEKCGELHAERNALADCRRRGHDPAGAVMYVTLEPCCHYGKTPPCTEAIIENRLGRVVIGSPDPNPLVAGKGTEILREAGVEVDGPVLEKECRALNRIFFHYITTGKPYVIMKYAMTADGKIATATGDSRWITNQASRNHTHLTRKQAAAILVGIGTVLADDPTLNCRYEDENGQPDLWEAPSQAGHSPDPVRVISDSRLRIPLDSRIIGSADRQRTIIAYAEDPDNADLQKRAAMLQSAGAELLPVPADAEGHADLAAILNRLGEMGLDSVLIEGGSRIHFSAAASGMVSEVQVYIAPKIIGGQEAKTPVGGEGIPVMADCIRLGAPEIRQFGEDVLLTYRRKE